MIQRAYVKVISNLEFLKIIVKVIPIIVKSDHL